MKNAMMVMEMVMRGFWDEEIEKIFARRKRGVARDKERRRYI